MTETEGEEDRTLAGFIEHAKTSKEVWTLEYPDGGFAVCPSTEFDEIDVYVVWSDKTSAQVCCVEDWKDLVPFAIDLDSFVEDWLPGMYKDGFLVGPNWDAELTGPEVAALDLAKMMNNT
ncbi:MAG: DUF2750 domain-containing protein [Methyloligellaceae bacterium]